MADKKTMFLATFRQKMLPPKSIKTNEIFSIIQNSPVQIVTAVIPKDF